MSNICFICLKDIDKLQTVYVNGTEEAVKQIKYVLPEITLEPEIPVHICSTCHTKLHSFCTFKKQCLENYYRITEKLRELGNAKDQSLYAFPIETVYIKEENENEAPEERNNQINYITEEDTIKTVQDETISLGLQRNMGEVSGMADDIKTFKCEEQHDQTNNFIEDRIYIKEDIKFENSEEPNLYQKLLPDIKKEIDNEQNINEIECADLKLSNLEHMKLDMKTHTGIKDFQCFICEKKFTKNSNMKQHMKTHTGTKDFQCSICEKKFTLNNSLKLHMKTHTGVKDFHCSICNKKFIRNSQLKLHMKTHAGIKDFQCSICEKKFTQQSDLNLHMKTHTGVKDFQCSICEKKFLRNSDMKRHTKTHIGVKDL